MKKLNQLLLVVLILIGFGCTDLQDNIEDGIGEEVVEGGGAAVGDPAAALEGVYSQLNGLTDQANTYALLEHPSDEMMGPTRGTDWSDFGVWRQLHAHQWDPSHSYVLGAWNQLNSGVFRATQVIDAPSANPRQVAEAKFLRAFFMFYVMDLYGQVPFRASDAAIDDVPEVKSRAEAFDFILDDLNSARAELPDLASGADAGTASKQSVDFLLAKMYLNKAVYLSSTSESPSAGPYNFDSADMERVIELADQIVANSYLELTPNYFDNFHWENTTRSSELIFVIDNEAGGPSDKSVRNRYYMTLHYNQTPSSWNGFTTIADFYSKFTDDNDIRKGSEVDGMTDITGLRAGFLQGQQFGANGQELTDRGGAPLAFTEDVDLFYSNERQGVRVIKYLVNGSDPDIENPGTDYIFYRYADVLLMCAEAYLRNGNNARALEIVNNVRASREGADQLTSIDEQTMLDERGREMYWEGWRRNDQIRFGVFNEAWNEKEPSEPYRVLFPIPQRALDTNPNLVQNSGY